MNQRSLRSQLWLWMLPVVAVWIVSIIIVYFFAVDLARTTYDEELTEVARSISTTFQTRQGLFKVELPQPAIDILTYDLRDKFYFQVVGPRGHSLAGEAHFPPAPQVDAINKPVFTDGIVHGQQVRIATIKVPVANDQFALVRVAETLTAREQLTNRILLTVLIPGVICIALLAGTLYVAIGRALAPLEVIKKNVDARSYQDLDPLADNNVPIEVAPLVRAINLLLGRLRTDIEAHRRFVANAAHQLRTPLAGIQTQTELALAENDARTREQILRKIHIGAERGSRLVHQLLTLARVDESIKDAHRHMDSVELRDLASSCIEEMLDDAQRKNIELVFNQTESLVVNGDAQLLREMLLNIIDNAIRYSKDGACVTIEVAGSQKGDLAILKVVDNGNGIPAEDRQRVFERFYRVMGSPAGGSGLGLAIVQEIAAAHKGSVDLQSGKDGSTVTVMIPVTAKM